VRRAIYIVLSLALVASAIVYVVVHGFDLGGWHEFWVAAAYLTAIGLLNLFTRRRAERERRERDKLVDSILGRDRYTLPPLAERDQFYADVQIAERPVEHVHVPWYRSWRSLLLLPLPAGIVGAALQGSGWWLLLVFVGLVLAVAYLFTRAFEKELERPGIGSPQERLS
jgi:membrane protein implicated in regulation of membrane protease activity